MEAKTGDKQMKKHVLVLPFPAQSHINPMLQFSKTLVSNHSTNIKVTLVTTISISKHKNLEPNSPVSNLVNIDFISDGFDEDPFASSKPQNNQTYFPTLETFGSKSLHDLILKYSSTNNPIHCVVYEPFMPWALDVAKHFGIFAAAFFTQPCLVEYIYFSIYHKMLKLPISSASLPVEIVGTGIPPLELRDLPTMELYPFNFDMCVNQFSNIHKADCIFFNSFYKLENQVVDLWSQTCPILTIGPTIPSWYLYKHTPNDDNYGLDMLAPDTESKSIMSWLKNKQRGSVVYVAFGSLIKLSEKQMEELAWGLKRSNHYYLWATTDREKIPKDFVVGDKGLIVTWTSQLKVLSNEAIGCFLTHCGWNSVIEALSLGVPMVAMPQWSDEPMNAKLIEDVWRVGVRVREVGDENGGLIVKREEIEVCVKEVMEGERGVFARGNAKKWKEEAVKAVGDGGSSWDNVNVFVSKLMAS